MTRQCGYCRVLGHNKTKCPVLEFKIDTIKKAVPLERKRAIDLATMNGYGVGAIVSAYSYRRGESVNAVILSHKESLSKYLNQCIEYRNVKYQKRVRVIMKNFSGLPMKFDNPLSNGEIGVGSQNTYYLNAMNLSDPSETLAACIVYNNLKVFMPNVAIRRGFSYDNHSEVLDPSYDTDASNEDFISNIPGHDRLGKDDFTGIVTW